MKDAKVELINRSKQYDRGKYPRPRATIFRDKSKYHRPDGKHATRVEIEDNYEQGVANGY